MSKRPWDEERKKSQFGTEDLLSTLSELEGTAFQKETFERSTYFRELHNGTFHYGL